MKRTSLVVGCLLTGVLGGAAGAHVVESAQRLAYFNTGIFTLKADDRASFHVSVDDVRSGSPSRVRLQFFTEAGTLAATNDVVLEPGQSTTLWIAGPGLFRAHAEVVESAFLTARHTVVATVEILNLTTEQRGPVCNVPDNGVDAGRQ
jgi:hypothetical protein